MWLVALLGAPAVAAPPALCAGTDRALFDCATSDNRRLVVCGGPGRLQYRFGPAGAPELVFPADAAPGAFTVEERRTVRSMADVLWFENGGFRYEVIDAIGGGGGDDAESNNFRGVVIEKPVGTRIASVSCRGEPRTDWEAIRAIVPPKPAP